MKKNHFCKINGLVVMQIISSSTIIKNIDKILWTILSVEPLVFNKFLMNFALLQWLFFFPFLLLKVQKIAKVNNSSE